MALELTINGTKRAFSALEPGAPVHELVASLGFRQDRVALELNGEIVPRQLWTETQLAEGDRLEVVHFVGGGSGLHSGLSR